MPEASQELELSEEAMRDVLTPLPDITQEEFEISPS